MLEARLAAPFSEQVQTKAPRRFPPPITLALLALCGWAFTAGLQAAGLKPDYYAARAFAAELQQDFNERNCIALLDRLDREALRQRIVRPLGEAIAENEQGKAVWRESILPSIEADIQSLDHMSSVSVGRVILLAEGDRAVECIFFDDKDSFKLLTLRLHQGADGRVGICDLKFMGSPLEFSQRIRQNILLRGFRSHDLLPDDEMALQRRVEGPDGSLAREILYRLAKGAGAAGYQTWTALSEDMQQSAIGQDLLTRLAGCGSKEAAAALRAEWKANPANNPFASYNLALAEHDLPRALAALDLVLQEAQQLAFLRGIKAGLLIKLGRHEEALQLARDVCELTPINGVSYIAAITAAAELHRPQVALDLLQRWGHVGTAEGIDHLLKAQGEDCAGLTAFLKSAAYQDWLRQAREPVTKKLAG